MLKGPALRGSGLRTIKRAPKIAHAQRAQAASRVPMILVVNVNLLLGPGSERL